MRDALGAVRLVVATAFRADRRGALAVIALYAVRSVTFTTVPLWLKLLADSATSGDARGALLAGVAAGAAATLTAFVGTLGANAAQLLQERTSLLVQERLARLALGVPGSSTTSTRSTRTRWRCCARSGGCSRRPSARCWSSPAC